MQAEVSLPGILLSNVKFFEPKSSFYDYMKVNHYYHKIYDVGAGVGHVTVGLRDLGMTVVALDMNRRDDPECTLLLANAMSYDYTAKSVLLFCRPCHGYFVESSIQQGIAREAKAFLYAGLPKNVDYDLGTWRRNFTSIKRNVGVEGESLYVWNRVV
jgi:hypothetical protein